VAKLKMKMRERERDKSQRNSGTKENQQWKKEVDNKQ
jgi:hypothetical protein